jgi:hypothetical protein
MNGRTDQGVRQGSARGLVAALRQRTACSAFGRNAVFRPWPGSRVVTPAQTQGAGVPRDRCARQRHRVFYSLNENSGRLQPPYISK